MPLNSLHAANNKFQLGLDLLSVAQLPEEKIFQVLEELREAKSSSAIDLHGDEANPLGVHLLGLVHYDRHDIEIGLQQCRKCERTKFPCLSFSVHTVLSCEDRNETLLISPSRSICSCDPAN
jgi:hypothetical protein